MPCSRALDNLNRAIHSRLGREIVFFLLASTSK